METFEIVQPFQPMHSHPLKKQYNIYRSKVDRERFYFTIIGTEFVKLPSVTTILSSTLPIEDWLIRWIARFGYEQAQEKKTQAAHYGTLFSIIASDFLHSGEIDLGTIEARINIYKHTNNISFATDFWNQKLKEDLYALACFAQDYNFEPLAIEIPLVSAKYRFAGTIDAIGYIKIGSGANGKILKKDKETRKILAIIDWKTGRRGFYRSHEAQLHMYRLLVEENFPDLCSQNELKLYNWAPKEWNTKDEPKYTLKDQTTSKEALRILNYLAIYRVEETSENHNFKVVEGVLRLGNIENNLKFLDYHEMIKTKIEQKPEPSNSKPQTESRVLPTNEVSKIEVEIPSDFVNTLGSFFQKQGVD